MLFRSCFQVPHLRGDVRHIHALHDLANQLRSFAGQSFARGLSLIHISAVADAAPRDAPWAVDKPDEGFAGDALTAAALAHEAERCV